MDDATILFFDLDGTLVVNPFRTAVWPYITSLLAPQTGLNQDQLRTLFLNEFNTRIAENETGETGLTVDWDDIVPAVMIRLGVHCDISITKLVIKNAHAPHIRILDEGESILQSLRENGNRKLVVSTMGMAKFQRPVLHGLGLLKYFSEILAPDLTGYLKTDCRHYRAYTTAYPVQNLISIGDNYYHDVEFPKSLGFTSILKAPFEELQAYDPLERCHHLTAFGDRISNLPENPSILPDAVITSLQELPEVIEYFERARVAL